MTEINIREWEEGTSAQSAMSVSSDPLLCLWQTLTASFFIYYGFGCLAALIFPTLDTLGFAKKRKNEWNENFHDFHKQMLVEGSSYLHVC